MLADERAAPAEVRYRPPVHRMTGDLLRLDTRNSLPGLRDFEMSDEILACAIQQQDVDPFRVYTAGCSAGGLQAGAMVYGRSSYLAAAMPNSVS